MVTFAASPGQTAEEELAAQPGETVKLLLSWEENLLSWVQTIWTAATCQFAAWKKRTPPCGLCHTPRPSLVKSLLKTRNLKLYTKSRLHLSGCRECHPLAALYAWTLSSENCENHPFSVLSSDEIRYLTTTARQHGTACTRVTWEISSIGQN